MIGMCIKRAANELIRFNSRKKFNQLFSKEKYGNYFEMAFQTIKVVSENPVKGLKAEHKSNSLNTPIQNK
jgi:hypothetical protein